MSLAIPVSKMQSSIKSVKHERLEQLDALRAIAVLMVMYAHWMPSKFIPNFLSPGGSGVSLFFVLSGYLITGILLSAGEKIGNGSRTVVIKSFVTRRALRIFPIYYLFIGASWLLSVGAFAKSTKWHMLFLTNFEVYHGQAFPAGGGHLWTLSVEEQFYLLWPWLVLYVFPRGYLLKVLGAILAVAILVRFYALPVALIKENYAFVLPLPAFDALVVGAILALVSADKRKLERFLFFCKYVALPVCLATCVLYERGFGSTIQVALLYQVALPFVFAMIIASAANGFGGLTGQILSSRPLVSIGTISYGLYLYHACVPAILAYAVVTGRLPKAILETSPLLLFITCLSITLLMGYASWFIIERPINAIKEYFPYVRKTTERPSLKEAAATAT
jgi:peptidoglycan/LPS O-acetylase OafA/YrhL